VKKSFNFSRSHGGGCAGNLEDFIGDGRLARFVVFEGQILDELLGIIGGALHGDHAGAMLGGAGLEDFRVEFEMDVMGEELAEQDIGLGSKL